MEKSTYESLVEGYPNLLSVDDLRSILGNIGRNKVYELLRTNTIHHVRIGRKYKIPKEAVINYFLLIDSKS
ncbi:helix-turn-helix domain-containing protein [Enterococcus lactis]|uniref:helix-turn-helix domain-containing protein n=1 Tax=Enterococcus lactis TaxID=357441 RepID=UPI00237C44B6|nr:helix-turn-helix domain-containing protein [Enterococcus lactis]